MACTYAYAAADVLRTDVLYALMLHLRPPFCLLCVCPSQMELLGFGLGPIQHTDIWFGGVHLGGVRVLAQRVGAPYLECCLCCRQWVGRSLIVLRW